MNKGGKAGPPVRSEDPTAWAKPDSILDHYQRLKRDVFSKTAKNSFLVLGGNIFTQGLSFLVAVIIARTLGPSDYGTFAVAYIFMIFAIDIADFGMEKSFIRYYSLYSLSDQKKADQLFSNLFALKLLIGVVLCFAVYLSSGYLAKSLFHSPELIVPLRLAGVGFIGGALLRFEASFFQATEQFKKYILVNLTHSIFRIGGLSALILLSIVSIDNSMLLYVIAFFSGLIFASFLLPNFRLSFPKSKRVFTQIFRLSKWIFVSTILVMVETRLDFFMLGHLSTREEVGYFSAAWNIAYILPLIIVSACTALFPRVSRMLSRGELKTYVKRLLSFCPLIVPVIIGAVFFSRWAILLVYGSEYLASVVPLQVLFMGYSLILLIVPVSLVLYSLDKAWAIAIVNLLELSSHGIANYFLIPSYGASGAAFSNLIVKIITTVGILVFVYLSLKKTDRVVEPRDLCAEVAEV